MLQSDSAQLRIAGMSAVRMSSSAISLFRSSGRKPQRRHLRPVDALMGSRRQGEVVPIVKYEINAYVPANNLIVAPIQAPLGTSFAPKVCMRLLPLLLILVRPAGANARIG